MKQLVIIAGLLLIAWTASAQRVVYVNASAPDGGTGVSWTTAFRSLQDALSNSHEGDELWIARGTYRADDGQGLTRGDTTASFVLRTRRSLYGGFRGTEATRAARDFAANPTVLTGDLLGNDTDSLSYNEPSRKDNTLYLVRMDTTATEGVVDGLTLTGARANVLLVFTQASLTLRNFRVRNSGAVSLGGSLKAENGTFERNYSARLRGGGAINILYGRLVATDVVFRENRDIATDAFSGGGGALRLFGGWADLAHATFEENRTPYDGGAIYNLGAPMRIASVRFIGNRARSAGALLVTRTRLTLSNAVFSGNEATLFDGGALVVEEPRGRPTQDSTLIYNSTFTGNRTAGCGGALHAYRSYRTVIRNSIFFGNTAATGDPDLCRTTFDPATDLIRVGRTLFGTFLPPGTRDEGGNLAGDPLFVNAAGPDGRPGTADDDLRLLPGSRARDTGDARWLPADSLDLDADGTLGEPLPLDLDGRPRVQGVALDLGAYEATPAVGLAADPRAASGVLHVWPSPARAMLTVWLGEHVTPEAPLTVYVFDALGRERLRKRVTAPEETLDVSMLAPGVYVAKAGVLSRRFVVAR